MLFYDDASDYINLRDMFYFFISFNGYRSHGKYNVEYIDANLDFAK